MSMRLALLLLLTVPQLLWAQIPIAETQVLQLNGAQVQRGLFDEPKLGKESPKKPFHPTYQKLYRPQEFLIDLKGFYQLDSIEFYDGAGRDSFLIYSGSPAEWNLEAALYTNRYNTWRNAKLKGHSQWLFMRFLGPQAEIGEMRIYGKKTKREELVVKPRKLRSPIRLKDFMGINAFVDDPSDKVEAVAGLVREYHNWDWHYPPEIEAGRVSVEGLRFSPTPAGNWNFDTYYTDLKKRGLKVYPCIQGSPPWLKENFDYKPQHLKYASDDPTAYRLHSLFIWQYAARYGSRTHVPTMLNLAKDQTSRSGLNLIAGIESWNEPDKWWRGREGYFHPFEYAAMLSADYDGHSGQLGRYHGLKQADPNLEFVMGGLAGLDTNYIEAIRIWAMYLRPYGDFPADALNFHHYSNDAGGQDDKAKHAIPPEEDGFRKKLEALVNYRNRKLPEKKIFLSEFGFDTNPKSIQSPAGGDSVQLLELQADYLVRSMLMAHASGIDGAFIYMLRDVNAANPNKYNSSGLTSEKWNKHRPKPSFYKLQNLKLILGDFVFEEQEQGFLENLIIYRYFNPNTKQKAYALWNPQDDQRSHYDRPYFLEENSEPSYYDLNSSEPVAMDSGFTIGSSPLILIYSPKE